MDTDTDTAADTDTAVGTRSDRGQRRSHDVTPLPSPYWYCRAHAKPLLPGVFYIYFLCIIYFLFSVCSERYNRQRLIAYRAFFPKATTNRSIKQRIKAITPTCQVVIIIQVCIVTGLTVSLTTTSCQHITTNQRRGLTVTILKLVTLVIEPEQQLRVEGLAVKLDGCQRRVVGRHTQSMHAERHKRHPARALLAREVVGAVERQADLQQGRRGKLTSLGRRRLGHGSGGRLC